MSQIDVIEVLRKRMKSKTTKKVSKDTFFLGFSTVSLPSSNSELRLEDAEIGGKHERVHKVYIPDNQQYKIGWILNRFCKKCMSCGWKFGISVRKHHCRICGGIFCSSCSKYRIRLDNLSEEEPTGSRACRSCHIRWPPVLKKGWLSKQSTNQISKKVQWSKKFCLLDCGVLHYFDNEDVSYQSGFLNLLEYSVQHLGDKNQGHDKICNLRSEGDFSDDSHEHITLISISESWANFPLILRCEPFSGKIICCLQTVPQIEPKLYICKSM